jgi:hypothetical protein
MQQILFAAAKKWFTPQRGTFASLLADTADGKIERLYSPALTSGVSV